MIMLRRSCADRPAKRRQQIMRAQPSQLRQRLQRDRIVQISLNVILNQIGSLPGQADRACGCPGGCLSCWVAGSIFSENMQAERAAQCSAHHL